MKPISEGDRPKVIVLSVLTVIVLALLLRTFLGMRAKGQASTPPSTTQPAPLSPPASTPTPKPETVASNTTKPSLSTPGFSGIEPGGPENPFRSVLPDPASFPRGGNPAPIQAPNVPAGSGLKGTFPVNPMNPKGNLAIAPDREAPPEPGLRLDGIVQDRAHFAMITVGDKTEMYRAGAVIANAYEVLSIDEFGASFRGPRGLFRLEVGQAREPRAAVKPSSGTPSGAASPLGILPLPTGG